MRIIVDADACPSINEIIEIANKYALEVHLFSDYSHNLDKFNAHIHYVSTSSQNVDINIVNFIKTNDIVITQDYGLACTCLAKECYVINQNGLIYNKQNIDNLLEQKYLGLLNRKRKIKTKNIKKRTSQTNETFLNNLIYLIESGLS